MNSVCWVFKFAIGWIEEVANDGVLVEVKVITVKGMPNGGVTGQGFKEDEVLVDSFITKSLLMSESEAFYDDAAQSWFNIDREEEENGYRLDSISTDPTHTFFTINVSRVLPSSAQACCFLRDHIFKRNSPANEDDVGDILRLTLWYRPVDQSLIHGFARATQDIKGVKWQLNDDGPNNN